MAKDRTPLDQAERHVSNAWWAALISAGVTVVFAFISLGGTAHAGIDAWAFADVVLILALAFGLSRKSRVCAILLFLYFVGSKLLMWSENPQQASRGSFVAIVFMYYFFMGIVGTFQWHSLAAGEAAAGPATGAGARTGTRLQRDPYYQPTTGSRRPAASGTPWLVWMVFATVLVVAAGVGWYYKPSRQLQEANARPPTPQEIEASLAPAVGLLSRVEMNGSMSPLAAAIAVDEGTMLVPCRGIAFGSPHIVKLDSQDLQVKVEALDEATGLCRLTVKDRGSWPLRAAPMIPKVGDSVFAAAFEPGGKVVVSAGQVRSVTQGAKGLVIESSARTAKTYDGSPLVDERGRVVAITIEGQDTALPPAWTDNWPKK